MAHRIAIDEWHYSQAVLKHALQATDTALSRDPVLAQDDFCNGSLFTIWTCSLIDCAGQKSCGSGCKLSVHGASRMNGTVHSLACLSNSRARHRRYTRCRIGNVQFAHYVWTWAEQALCTVVRENGQQLF